MLRYICVLAFSYKQLDLCIYTACQGICINVETLLESFLSIYFIICLSFIFLVTQQLEYRRATFHLVLGAKLIVPFSMPNLD